LADWADDKTKYLAVTGHGIAETSSANIYWALNYGTDPENFFDPEEIEWLKVVVRKTKEKKSTADSDEEGGVE